MRDKVTQTPREQFLFYILEMFLAAEEDDLLLQKQLVDRCHSYVGKVSAKADASDFGSDTAGQRYNVGLRDGLIDKDWIAHGNLRLIVEEDSGHIWPARRPPGTE